MKKAIIAAAILLAGCAHTNTSSNHYDPYLAQTTVLGEMVKEGNIFYNNSVIYRLEAKVKNGAEPTVRLYVGTSADKFGFLYSASDIDANMLTVLQIDSEVAASAPASHNVAVEFTRQYLENHKTAGLNIRLSGNHDSLVVKLTPEYVATFLSKLNETTKGS